jgi:hypothetical protein
MNLFAALAKSGKKDILNPSCLAHNKDTTYRKADESQEICIHKFNCGPQVPELGGKHSPGYSFFLSFFIVVLGVHCDIYKSSYSLSYIT